MTASSSALRQSLRDMSAGLTAAAREFPQYREQTASYLRYVLEHALGLPEPEREGVAARYLTKGMTASEREDLVVRLMGSREKLEAEFRSAIGSADAPGASPVDRKRARRAAAVLARLLATVMELQRESVPQTSPLASAVCVNTTASLTHKRHLLARFTEPAPLSPAGPDDVDLLLLGSTIVLDAQYYARHAWFQASRVSLIEASGSVAKGTEHEQVRFQGHVQECANALEGLSPAFVGMAEFIRTHLLGR